MVAAAMRTRFDQFGKQMVRDALEDRCSVETDAEVPADTRRIDLWVTPGEAARRCPSIWVYWGASPAARSRSSSFTIRPVVTSYGRA